jgi:hypothetical protein
MSAPLPLATPDIEITRTGVLATASLVVATFSVAVTLAVAGGGGSDEPAAAAGPRFATGITGAHRSPAAGPEAAQPDAATTYHQSAMQRRR